jgi:molybdenum cofactor biosynthesis protein B
MARVWTLTFSDTRTPEDDEGGQLLGQLLAASGHPLVAHRIAREDEASVAAALDEALAAPGVQAIVCTGGTGIAPRDIAIELIERRLERALPGFGEAFRRLSWEQVGPRSVLSRATAGTARGRLLVALPGSLKAVRLGVDALLVPILDHAVDLLEGRTGHGGR